MRTVLIIDDNAGVREALALALSLRDIRALAARGPDEGLGATAELARALLEHEERHPERGQRRPELVRGDGDELDAHLVEAGELGDVVEREDGAATAARTPRVTASPSP